MIAILGALIAGVVIWKLWPGGALFLVLWPALLVLMTLPALPGTMASYGYSREITPGIVAFYYLQNAAITALLFFIAFWIRNRVTRDRAQDSDTDHA